MKGRPRWEPDEKDLKAIETLTGLGMDQPMVADYLGISRATLQRRIADGKDKLEGETCPIYEAVRKGKALAASKVLSTAFKMATSGKCWSATQFYLQVRLGWSADNVAETEENKRKRPLSLVKREA